MAKLHRAPRSSKLEADTNREKLRKIWLRAFEQEEPLIMQTDSEKEALRLRSLLADYRSAVNKRKLENLDLWSKIYSLSLKLKETAVILEHKRLDDKASGLLLTKTFKGLEEAGSSTEFDRLVMSVMSAHI